MSQVLLGVRNLSLKIAVFVAIAALLAWFLGGSLLPRPTRLAGASVEVGRAGEGLGAVRLVHVLHPVESLPSERETWHIETTASGGFERWKACEQGDLLCEATTLSLVKDATGFGTAWFAARICGASEWTVYSIGGYEACPTARLVVADRLEAERQIARAVAGLPVQSAEAAKGARDAVLRAGDGAREDAAGTGGGAAR